MSTVMSSPRITRVRAVGPTARADTARFLTIVLVAYLACRWFSFVLISWIADHQDPQGIPGGPDGEHVGYLDQVRVWDGDWYRKIAEQGYPDQLPRQDDGSAQENAWAFHPLFPALVRLAMSVTGGSFAAVGSTLALILGSVAALVMAVLLRERLGALAAGGVVVVYAALPASPVLQMVYTESTAMLALCCYLLAMQRQHWLLAAAAAVLTGLARPIALPLGLVALVAVWLRWQEREQRPLGRRESLSMVVAVGSCGIAGLIWPAYAGWRTGVPRAYTETASAWRGGEQVYPFRSTIMTAQGLWGEVTGVVVLVALVVLLVLALAGPWAEGLGPVLRVWTGGYLLYLAAVLAPWTSIYRHLLFAFPLAAVVIGGGWAAPRLAGARQRQMLVRTAVAVLLALVWQVWWCWELLRIIPPTDSPI